MQCSNRFNSESKAFQTLANPQDAPSTQEIKHQSKFAKINT